MLKKGFLKKLGKALDTLPADERRKTLDYYSELIDDRVEAGAAEEDAVSAMGDVNAIAQDIISDAKERGVDLKNRTSKAPWIVLSIVLIVVSIAALCFAGWALLKYVFNVDIAVPAYAGEWQEFKVEYVVPNGGTIKTELGTYDVYWGVSEDDKVHVTYYENDIVKFNITQTDAGLTIIATQEKLPIFGFGWNENRQAAILIPADFEGNIDSGITTGETRIDGIKSPVGVTVSCTTGDTIVYDLDVLGASFSSTTGGMIMGRCAFDGALSVTKTTGECKLENVSSDSLYVKTSTGRMELSGIETGAMELHGTTGSVTIENAKAASLYMKATTAKTQIKGLDAAGSVEINGTTGSVTFENVNAATLRVYITTGRINASSVTVDSADLQTSTGKIVVEHLDAKNVTITATTGDVDASLVGSIADYSIESKTSTGDNTLPSRLESGDRKLKVTTSTGDIDVRFLG